MPVITRQPRLGLRNRRTQPLQPDASAPDQPAHILIRDLRVDEDG